MTDSMLSSAAPGGTVIDSLSANEFTVEIDGTAVTGVFRVTGLTSFKLDMKTSGAPRLLYEPFTITKMVQRDPNLPMNRWLRETLAARDDIARPTRTVAIVAVDDDVETRRWVAQGAYITEVSYSEFNTASGELIEETLTIHCESIDESWSVG